MNLVPDLLSLDVLNNKIVPLLTHTDVNTLRLVIREWQPPAGWKAQGKYNLTLSLVLDHLRQGQPLQAVDVLDTKTSLNGLFNAHEDDFLIAVAQAADERVGRFLVQALGIEHEKLVYKAMEFGNVPLLEFLRPKSIPTGAILGSYETLVWAKSNITNFERQFDRDANLIEAAIRADYKSANYIIKPWYSRYGGPWGWWLASSDRAFIEYYYQENYYSPIFEDWSEEGVRFLIEKSIQINKVKEVAIRKGFTRALDIIKPNVDECNWNTRGAVHIETCRWFVQNGVGLPPPTDFSDPTTVVRLRYASTVITVTNVPEFWQIYEDQPVGDAFREHLIRFRNDLNREWLKLVLEEIGKYTFNGHKKLARLLLDDFGLSLELDKQQKGDPEFTALVLHAKLRGLEKKQSF